MIKYSIIKKSQLATGIRIDSEFYRPEYLFLEKELKTFKNLKIKQFAKVTDGEHGSVKLRTRGIKYLTAENIKNGYVDVNKIRYVDDAVDKRNARARVRAKDILVSIKGTLGEIALAEEWLLPANMNRDVAIIKPYNLDNIINEYLAVFLMSKFGIFQSQREGSGGVQQMITLGRLREFLVPVLDFNEQIKISELYTRFLSERAISNSLYSEAAKLFEDELGFSKLNIQKSKWHTGNISKAIQFHRIDSEYFQPHYAELRDLIRNYKFGFESLLLNVKNIKPSFNPKVFPSKEFRYIELAGINPSNGSVTETTKLFGKDAPSRAKRIVQTGDIIASSVVGSVDKAALISEEENNCLASSGFFHLRSSFYNSYYLLILLKSKTVTGQLQQEATGGILSAVPDANLRHIIIPKLPREVQEEIASLVKRSHIAFKNSKELLLASMQKVEELIAKESILNRQL